MNYLALPLPVVVVRWWWTYDRDEAMMKAAGAQKGRPKYIRRVPTGNPKRPWRYIYSEQSVARRVTEGERVMLGDDHLDIDKIEKKGGKVSVHVTDSKGRKRKLSAPEMHALMREHYGERFDKAVEKLAKRWGRAGLRIEALRKKGLTPDNVGDVAADVHARIRRTLGQTHLDEHWCASLMSFVLSRKGWSDKARAEVANLAAEDAAPGALYNVAANLRQVVRAAENLQAVSGEKSVNPDHVQLAMGLRFPGGKYGDERAFEAEVGKLKKRLQADVKSAQAPMGALKDAVEAGNEKAAVAAFKALPLETGWQLQRYADAFPGLADDPDLEAHHALEREADGLMAELQQSKQAAAAKSKSGSETRFYVADEDGFAKPVQARYRLVEADDLIASHKPGGGFAKDERYPEGVQERTYHTSKAEQQKVLRNADRFQPDIVMNTNPDAVNGPPVVTPDNVVLGGNSRSMTIKHLYSTGRGEKVKEYLEENAHQFGLAKGAVAAMKNPVLVRELPEVTSKTDKKELREWVRRANESFTNSLDPRAAQVALANRIDDGVLDTLTSMEPDETLNSFLTSARSRDFVKALSKAGVIDNRNSDQYLSRKDPTRLNEDGKRFVERILVGKMVPDPELLSELPQSTLNNLSRNAPYIVGAAGYGSKHDLSEDLRVALKAEVDRRLAGLDNIDTLARQAGLDFGTGGSVEHPIARNERAQMLHEVITGMGVRQSSDIFKQYLDAAKRTPEGSVDLFGGGREESGVDVFKRAFATAQQRRMAKGWRLIFRPRAV